MTGFRMASRTVWAWAGCLAVVLGGMGSASAAGLLEQNFYLSGPRYSGHLPACDTRAALDDIAGDFASKESKFWQSDLKIVSFDDVRETAYRPWAADTIPRRFCSAKAFVSDGHWRPVYYFIGEDTSMIGASWGVQWCVTGLDRNWAYNPTCKMARP